MRFESYKDRDQAILEHVARYRITTNEILQNLFFEGARENTKNVVKRLTKQDLLHSQPLYGKKVYYQLTTAGAERVGLPREAAQALGSQSLRRCYGVLGFCHQTNEAQAKPRRRLAPGELAEAFPDLVENLSSEQHDYYLDHDGKTVRLGFIKVDYGGDHKGLLRHCRQFVTEKARKTPVLKELVANELFVVAIVTGEESKRQAFYTALKQKPLPVWTRVEVFPDLASVTIQTQASPTHVTG